MRNGDWMQTFTGRSFWPLDPQCEDVDINDIAHALSLLCRYNGHVERFYSVAEHCCHIHDCAAPENRKWALLHDASEAYLSDVIRPIKPFLQNYRDIEVKLMAVIGTALGFGGACPAEVLRLDSAILGDERDQAMAPPPQDWRLQYPPLGITLCFWNPDQAEREFLKRYEAFESSPPSVNPNH